MLLDKVLKIAQFEPDSIEQDFYSNQFSVHLEEHHKNITRPHKHDFFLTMIFTHGKGTHEIDFQTYTIEPGTVFMLQPGQTHNWKFTEPPEGYIFFHTQEFYELPYSGYSVFDLPFYQSAKAIPMIKLSQEKAAKMISLFKDINTEYYKKRILFKEKINALVYLTYLELSRYYVGTEKSISSKSGKYWHQLKAFERLIEKHFLTEKSPSVYAEKLHITVKHLNRITRQLIGKTTSELIMDRVILEAKRRLIYSDDSFSNIAYSLGYEDYSYFSRIFKNHTGVTPSQFSGKY